MPPLGYCMAGEPIYQSTNQSPISMPRDVDPAVDDYMFLRPAQSEFVMLQFGDLLRSRTARSPTAGPSFTGPAEGVAACRQEDFNRESDH